MRRVTMMLALVVASGCAMKVNGFVSDARTERPIGGSGPNR